MLRLIAAIVCSYLLGSISFAILLTYLVKGVDVRRHGSLNAGATNVYRIAGIWTAIAVGLLDLVKGFAATFFLARWFSAPELLSLTQLQILCALAVVIGHMFPLFAGFKGGKGVLAATGALLALAPAQVGSAAIVFALVLSLTRIVSLGSICASLAFLLSMVGKQLLLHQDVPLEVTLLSVVLPVIIIFAHRSNIRRLISGTEHRIGRSGNVS